MTNEWGEDVGWPAGFVFRVEVSVVGGLDSYGIYVCFFSVV